MLSRTVRTPAVLVGVVAYLMVSIAPSRVWGVDQGLWQPADRNMDAVAVTLSIGHYSTIRSKVLNEKRTILVHLPEDYETSSVKYPVLYVLDGEGTERFIETVSVLRFLSGARRLPKMIVVGVLNTDRSRDLTPRKVKGRKSSGGGNVFLEFLISELHQVIERRYRSEDFRILFGGSSAGLFAVYALLSKPESFNASIASRPVLNSIDGYEWDSDFVIRAAEDFVAEKPASKSVLYLDHGGLEDALHDPAPIYELAAILEGGAPQGFRVEVRTTKESGYRSAESLKDGLLSIFHLWYYPADSIYAMGYDGIENHAKEVSRELGYSVTVADLLDLENAIMFGYNFLERDKPGEAISLFEHAVEAWPESWEAHEGLGEAHLKNGDDAEAIKCFKHSLGLNSENEYAEKKLKQLRHSPDES